MAKSQKTRKTPTAFAVSLLEDLPGHDDGALVLRGVRVSSARLDRDNEVVDPEGCRLDDFRSNPVALWCHDQKELPVGRWADEGGNCSVVATADGVFGDIYFAKSNPRGPILYGLYREKVMRAFSVGFVPVAGGYLSDQDAKMLGSRGRAYLHREWNLLEISCVPVGANPDALAKCVGKGMVAGEKLPSALLRKLAEFVPTIAMHRAFPSGQATTESTILKRLRGNAVAKSKAKTETAKTDTTVKEMDTLSDTGGGSLVDADAPVETPEPHDQVKAGLVSAMHSCIEKLDAGEMTVDEVKAALDSYFADHAKYSESEEEEDEPVEAETKDDDSDDDSDMDEFKQATVELVEKVTELEKANTALETELKALRSTLTAPLAKLADLPTADELAEAIA